MRRTIKFRAWDSTSKRMYQHEEIQEYTLEQLNRLTATDDPYTKLMQFTGLKDKNGVGIYEGDIVRWYCDDDLSDNAKEARVDTVKFLNGHFWPVSGPTHTCFYSVENPVIEVIGNIHQEGLNKS